MTKKIARPATVALLGALALAAWWFLPGRHAEARLPYLSPVPVPRAALSIDPIYLQTDPKWATEKIGGSGESLRRVGCTICCLSMALAHHGIDLDPKEINRKLIEADGYTFRGWVTWDALRRISDGRVHVELPQNPTNTDIDKALDEGNPVLVKIRLKSGVQHWVLLVGREQQEYLMKDPLGTGQRLEPLSSLGSEIFAVRIVKKTNAKIQ